MNQQEIIERTIFFVKNELQNAEGGHDWWHTERVWNNAKHIATSENANLFVVELGALLHDIADAKFYNGDENVGPEKARVFLKQLSVDENIIQQVADIIKHISFKGGNFTSSFFSPELAVVQDADRLDALGAIGIARAFNYGGFTGRELYNPLIRPEMSMDKEQYKKSTAPTINHFYEKLLLLKDLMNTASAKKIAQQRHEYMQGFLEEFYGEWNGEK